MMQQYLKIKEANSDCIIFFRLGDFYEMFFEDANLAHKLLGLTLTARDCGMKQKAPMCGVPYHASDDYIAKLVNLGYKVAICEQSQSSTDSKIMEREIVRIVTAGTAIESSMLDEKTNNFLLCVVSNETAIGLAWADISTGEFFTTELSGSDYIKNLEDNLVRISPSEVICNSPIHKIGNNLSCVTYNYVPKFNSLPDYYFDYNGCLEQVLNQLNVQSLNGFDINDKKLSIMASGALLQYCLQTQKRSFSNIKNIKYVLSTKYMALDAFARKNLELTSTIYSNKRKGSLLWLLDNTKTHMGARNLLSWIEQPLQDINEINYRLDAVEELQQNQILSSELSENLAFIRDIERLTGKISYGSITPKECYQLNQSLKLVCGIKQKLQNTSSEFLNDVYSQIDEIEKIIELLDSAIVSEDTPSNTKEGGYIKQGFNAELDRLNQIKSSGKKMLSELEIRQRNETQIKNLRLGYNRVFGYYYDVTKSYQHLVPEDWERKQTLSNAERYINEELKHLENEILSAEELSINLEINLYNEVKSKLLCCIKQLLNSSRAIANLDSALSLSLVSKKFKYSRPKLVDKDMPLNIKNGRHPVVEALLNEEVFVPNDTFLDMEDDNLLIITGPNMAGKSTYMRQVALIVLLSHIGSFVPAVSAEIPITDRIFTRVGANDNLAFSQSTFMVEMIEMSNILKNATKNSLLILDEIGRGTSTYDGLSIAWSIVEYIVKNIGAKTLFSTHYHELTELEGSLQGVKNYRITVKEYNDSIIFLRKIVRGGANRSFGVEVAKLAGLPVEIIENAKILLNKLNQFDINNKNIECETVSVKADYVDIIDTIKDVDVNTCSPLEAINILFKIKERLNKG